MRKVWLVLLASVMLLLAACGGGNNDNKGQTSNDGGNATGGGDKQENVTLRYSWWGSDDRHKAILEAIEKYENLNPHVKIEAEYGAFGTYYQKLLTELSGGTAPDIISVDYKWVQDLISKGKPFVDMYTMQDQIDMSGIDMDFAAEQAGDGTYLLGLPLAINTMGLVYNKQMLEDIGIEVTDDWDWDDLMEAGIKLHQSDNSKYLMIMNTNHYIYMMKSQIKQKTGNNLILDDYTFGFEREDMVAYFEYLKALFDNGVIPPLEEAVQYGDMYAEQVPGWLDGTYALTTTSASKIPPIDLASTFETGVARYPVYKDYVNPGIITTPSMLITINKESKHIDESAKFINWLLNDREANLSIKDTIGLPAVESAANLLLEENLVNEKIAEMVHTAMPFAGTAENAPSTNPEVDSILKDYVERLGYNLLTPEEAADGLMKDVMSKLEEIK